MSNNYSFMILADGSIYSTAANLSSNKVSFDKNCIIGGHSIETIKNNLKKVWVRICSILVVGFSHSGSVNMDSDEYFPLITTLEYDNMAAAAIPTLNVPYKDEWDTGFYVVQRQSFLFTSSGITRSPLPSGDTPGSPAPSLYFSDEAGKPVPFMFKDDGIYVELDSNYADSIYVRINFPDRGDVQTIGMIIQSEDSNIAVIPPSSWQSDGCNIQDYSQTSTPNWKCSAPSGGNINPAVDDDLKIQFSLN